MTDVLNYSNIKPVEIFESKVKNLIENEDNILELEECNICMSRGVNKLIKCQTCEKCICTSCCNFMKSFKYERALKFKDNCGVSALYDCPFCRSSTETAFSVLSKEDILEFVKIDYIKFIVIGNKYDRLQHKYDDLQMKIMKLEHLKNKENDNEIIDFLIEENNTLKSVVENIDFYVKNNNETVKQNKELTEELFDLKKKHKELIENNKKIFEENKELIIKNEETVQYNNSICEILKLSSIGHSMVVGTFNNMINSNGPPKKIVMKLKKYMKEELEDVELKVSEMRL